MSTPAKTEEKKEGAPFQNKTGYGTTRLRLKDEENEEQAIKRLTMAGWILPDRSKMTLDKDAISRYFKRVE